MLTEKLKEYAYNISADIEESMMCLNDIEKHWERGEEIRESEIELCRDELRKAYHTAKTIEITMKGMSEYLKTISEVLNDRNY